MSRLMGTGYGYDGAGNPTTYQTSALTFDPENRLSSYGSAQTDAYDGDGLRAWKQTGASSTRRYFLYDGSQAVIEYGSTGSLLATNTFSANGLLSRQSGGSRVYYTFDERGNISQRLDAGATIQSSDGYDAYGTRSSTVSVQPDP